MTLPPARKGPTAPRIVIPAFASFGVSGHSFNELLLFKNESLNIGLTPRILVPRSTDERVAAEIEADRVLELLPAFEVNGENFVLWMATFADTARHFAPLRAWLDAECLTSSDIIYFPRGHPVLISGIGKWLSEKTEDKRPAVFFRIIGDELTDLDTGRFKPRAAFYRLASADLDNAPARERVFFLVNSSAKARSVARVLRRRSFMMQHHFGRPPDTALATETVDPTVYVHVNSRSGRCLTHLGETIRRVREVEPATRFVIKPAGDISDRMVALDLGDGGSVEVLPLQMSTTEYFGNLARSTLVVLAYEAQPYRFLTSGVFTEAAGLGKPVIVPRGTWMADKIAEGYGVGMSFADHSPQTLAEVILKGLQDSRQLASDARALAPRLAEETGCRRFIETMVSLSKTTPDMEPSYRIADEINFGDALDSRGFMGNGWSETEPWGTWTIGSRAELSVKLAAKPDRPLFLNAFAFAHLPRQDHGGVNVRVYCGDQPIAEWTFTPAEAQGGGPRWFSAPLPAPEHLGCALDFVFEIEGATSPHAEGLSHDRRVLGLGLCKLAIAEAAEGSVVEQAIEEEAEKEGAPGPQKVRMLARLVNRMRN
jgi:glycosyltransferase involved in cell wall biosynthesis